MKCFFYKKRKMLSLISAVMVLITLTLTFVGCDDKVSGSILCYPMDTEPVNLDPQIATEYSARLLLQNVMEGLTRKDSSGNIVPGVAAKWDVNDDSTSYTFYLRRNALWSNGANVTAKDFEYAFKRGADGNTGVPSPEKFYVFKNGQKIHEKALSSDQLGVEALDDYTLKINCETSTSNLPEVLSDMMFLPCNEEFFLSTNGRYGRGKDSLIYNGPFKIASWNKNDSIYINTNAKYNGEVDAVPGGIRFIIGLDQKEKIDYLKENRFDAALLTGKDVTSNDIIKQMSVTSFKDTTWVLAFNCKNDYFSNEDLRSAFAKSIESDFFTDKLPVNLSLAETLLPADAQNTKYGYEGSKLGIKSVYNKPSAKNHLDNGLATLGLSKLSKLEIICPDNSDIKHLIGYVLQSWQKNLGQYVNLVSLSDNEFENRIAMENYTMAVMPLKGTDDNPLHMIKSVYWKQDTGCTGYSWTYGDGIIDSLTYENNLTKIGEGVTQIEKQLINASVVVPIFNEESYFVTPTNIKGIKYYPFNMGVDFTNAIKSK